MQCFADVVSKASAYIPTVCLLAVLPALTVDIWWLMQGSASHIAIHTTEIMTLRKRINELYAHHTGQSASLIGKTTMYTFAMLHINCLFAVSESLAATG